MQHNLPALEQQLEKARVALEEAEQQQELLVGLLAGRDKIQTFLALLNQQALLSDVEIQRYEPLQEPMPSSESQQRTSRSTSEIEEGSSEPTEPLLVLGYQKTSVALEVSGPYNGLQEFLQRMEGLEVLVASSDLEIAAAVQDNDEEGTTPPIESRTRLTVQLTFYDRSPAVRSIQIAPRKCRLITLVISCLINHRSDIYLERQRKWGLSVRRSLPLAISSAAVAPLQRWLRSWLLLPLSLDPRSL